MRGNIENMTETEQPEADDFIFHTESGSVTTTTKIPFTNTFA
jgi:hypothetical protein